MDIKNFLTQTALKAGWTFKFWGTPLIMTINVIRLRKTTDGIFGKMTLDWDPFTCFTVENLAKAIPIGNYSVIFDYSPRFNRQMPHVLVPERDQAAGGDAGIRIHWGNFPSNYEGCIGVGNGIETDSIDNTVATFNQLYGLIKDVKDLKLTVVENYLQEVTNG